MTEARELLARGALLGAGGAAAMGGWAWFARRASNVQGLNKAQLVARLLNATPETSASWFAFRPPDEQVASVGRYVVLVNGAPEYSPTHDDAP